MSPAKSPSTCSKNSSSASAGNSKVRCPVYLLHAHAVAERWIRSEASQRGEPLGGDFSDERLNDLVFWIPLFDRLKKRDRLRGLRTGTMRKSVRRERVPPKDPSSPSLSFPS